MVIESHWFIYGLSLKTLSCKVSTPAWFSLTVRIVEAPTLLSADIFIKKSPDLTSHATLANNVGSLSPRKPSALPIGKKDLI
jgi:hypothetical protein